MGSTDSKQTSKGLFICYDRGFFDFERIDMINPLLKSGPFRIRAAFFPEGNWQMIMVLFIRTKGS